MQDLEIGDKVKHIRDNWYGGKWIGTIKEKKLSDTKVPLALIKWDESYEHPGIWMLESEVTKI